MWFRDRFYAGETIVPFLKQYENAKDAVVIGLPRGGVQTAYAVAKGLHLPLDVYSVKKIGAPRNPELALGAVSSSGALFLNQDIIDAFQISDATLKRQIEMARRQAEMRLKQLRPQKERKKFNTVILVDDGLATGATMKAAIQQAKAEGAKNVVVAVPVSSRDTYEEIQQMADEVVVVSLPPFFQAVGQFYENFKQVEDYEVIKLLRSAAS